MVFPGKILDRVQFLGWISLKNNLRPHFPGFILTLSMVFPCFPWSLSALSRVTMDIVQAVHSSDKIVHGHCPWFPWNMRLFHPFSMDFSQPWTETLENLWPGNGLKFWLRQATCIHITVISLLQLSLLKYYNHKRKKWSGKVWISFRKSIYMYQRAERGRLDFFHLTTRIIVSWTQKNVYKSIYQEALIDHSSIGSIQLLLSLPLETICHAVKGGCQLIISLPAKCTWVTFQTGTCTLWRSTCTLT